jgi:hypothetical protein
MVRATVALAVLGQENDTYQNVGDIPCLHEGFGWMQIMGEEHRGKK